MECTHTHTHTHTSSYLREVLVNDGESQFVDLLIAVLLQCLYLVQSLTLLDHHTHLLQLLYLIGNLGGGGGEGRRKEGEGREGGRKGGEECLDGTMTH